ncbi:MAG TPA: cation transporter [Parafilimonas sp.]|nr:cation transporter [Parafilimonas sp.]
MAGQHLTSSNIAEVDSKTFIAGIVLNMLFVGVEFVTGFVTDSIALLSDAGHNLSDVESYSRQAELKIFSFCPC